MSKFKELDWVYLQRGDARGRNNLMRVQILEKRQLYKMNMTKMRGVYNYSGASLSGIVYTFSGDNIVGLVPKSKRPTKDMRNYVKQLCFVEVES